MWLAYIGTKIRKLARNLIECWYWSNVPVGVSLKKKFNFPLVWQWRLNSRFWHDCFLRRPVCLVKKKCPSLPESSSVFALKVFQFFSQRSTSQQDQTESPYFNSITFLDAVCRNATMLRSWGLETQHVVFKRDDLRTQHVVLKAGWR